VLARLATLATERIIHRKNTTTTHVEAVLERVRRVRAVLRPHIVVACMGRDGRHQLGMSVPIVLECVVSAVKHLALSVCL